MNVVVVLDKKEWWYNNNKEKNPRHYHASFEAEIFVVVVWNLLLFAVWIGDKDSMLCTDRSLWNTANWSQEVETYISNNDHAKIE